MDKMTSTLAAHPFLAGLSPEYLQLVTECASLINFAADQVIFKVRRQGPAVFPAAIRPGGGGNPPAPPWSQNPLYPGGG